MPSVLPSVKVVVTESLSLLRMVLDKDAREKALGKALRIRQRAEFR
jgi:hypothetical protein